MPMKITSAVLESFLLCHLKGYLKLRGDVGTVSEFEQMVVERRADIRLKVAEALLAKEPADSIDRCVPLTVTALKSGNRLILDAVLENDVFSLHFDGLTRVEGSSGLGRFYYVPMLIHDSRQIRKLGGTLLALHGLTLARVQGKRPEFGFIWNGKDGKSQKVRVHRYLEEAERIMVLI